MEVSEARRAPGSPEATVWRITGVWAVATLLGVCELFELGVSCAAVAGIGAAGIVAFAALRAAVRRARDRTGPEPLTAATVITTLRAAALTLLGVALVVDTAAVAAIEWIAPGLFAAAAGGDAVDGTVARARDAVTDLGAALDAEIDGATVLVGTTVAVATGAAPVWFVGVGLARPLFAYGRRRRRRRHQPVYPLQPSRLRRPIGAATMAVTWLTLVPTLRGPLTRALAVAVTVLVVVSFVRDWLVVSGRR